MHCHEKANKRKLCSWPTCGENNGHEQFIPIKTFELKHLPKNSKNESILNEIKLLAILTVRVVVTTGNNMNNTRSQCSRKIITGTGTVDEVNHDNYSSCQELLSTQLQENLAIIRIKTAYHLVSSDLNVQNTTVDLFYDDENDKKNVRQLKGTRMVYSNEKEDWSVFECLTSDVQLANFLGDNLREFSKQMITSFNQDNLAIIVSHPHGLSKHVSVGKWRCSIKNSREKGKHQFKKSGLPFGRPRQEYIQDVGILIHIFDFLTIFNVAMVNKCNKSETVGIECDVDFPDGTSGKCQIWRFDKAVKETKIFLMSEANINIPEDELYLEIELPDGQTQIMKDDIDIEYYLDDLSCAFKIIMKQH